jgi:hypothetical protein
LVGCQRLGEVEAKLHEVTLGGLLLGLQAFQLLHPVELTTPRTRATGERRK